MTSPFRDAPIPPTELRRILRRAAELAERDPETAKVERAMTRSELEVAAAELGLPASAIARAIDHAEDDDSAPAEAKGNWFLGGKTRIVLERVIPGEPSQEEREDLLEEIREVAGDSGTVESVGNTLVWHATPNRNAPHSLTVRMRFRDGRTRVVLEERMLSQAIGLFVGLGVGGGIGPMGLYITAAIKYGAIALLMPALWIPLMLLLARFIFVGMTRRRARTMREMMRRIESTASRWQGPKPARVAVDEKRVETAEPLEPEDEAEPERRERR